jgi:hypothetical protein
MLADPDTRRHAAAVRATALVQAVRYTVNLALSHRFGVSMVRALAERG